MMNWRVGEAKQRLSELLRKSEGEPQLIHSRDRLVAVVISAELFAQFDSWRQQRHRRTLAQTFDEVREICREEDYVLDIGWRTGRATGMPAAE